MSGRPYWDEDRDEDKVLAGEYALGLLPPDEAAGFAARLGENAALRALVRQWTEDFTGLSDLVEPQVPPVRVHQAIEARIFSGPARGPLGLFRRVGVPMLTAAALILALFLGIDHGPSGVHPPVAPVYRAEIEATDGGLYVAAAYDAGAGEFYVERRAGAARPGRVLELWLIEGDGPPVSLGVLPEAARARLPVAEPLRARLEGGILALSDEPSGGSPDRSPTGDVLAVGPLGTP
ncbi:anti-sigma factor [Roseovarius aestuariivivens]|uniref:anti-sigma factor n=1 Tax=Roseovarius aestuariivivens TaxID=1888910 RepID=UPI001080302D|nr:anti-sigma factor [Roseovarius aestuariivivens]